MPRAVVVGAGHNGLVCAAYLARAGVDVLVLEQAPSPGGGAQTAETIPGYRFDLHSVAHNILQMTPVVQELELEAAGLRYAEMDPFAVAVTAGGDIVRFHRSVRRTVASIAELSEEEAVAYEAFMSAAMPLVDVAVSGLVAGGDPRRTARRVAGLAPGALRALARPDGLRLLAGLGGSYERLLLRRLRSDLTRGPVAAFAAHASAGPRARGGALFAVWQAAYHRFGQWHAMGGAGALADALVRRVRHAGGEVRCNAAVERIDRAPLRVVLEDGGVEAADVVVTATDVQLGLLGLLRPPLDGRAGRALRAARRGRAVQAVVHVAAGDLPRYRGARAGDHAGLQSYVDRLEDLASGFSAAEAGRVPSSPAPAYAFTPSALDDALAPPGEHTAYLACPCAPSELAAGTWEEAAPRLAEDLLAQVEARAPGFRATVRGVHVRTPAAMAAELRWPGAHPMHLDVTPGQLGPLRPTRALASHRTPVDGLYVTGAGTAPTGGIAGAPGRAAARAVLRDLRR